MAIATNCIMASIQQIVSWITSLKNPHGADCTTGNNCLQNKKLIFSTLEKIFQYVYN